LGFKLSDLAGGTTEKSAPKKAKAKKAPANPQFRDPNDKSKTWAGRGARPAWLKDALAKGAKLEDFKI
jgi:DNA-binding protein H-NS